jgi:hypothetical protein
VFPGLRPALAWLVALPLIALGTQAAHALDYRLVLPGAERARILEATGHDYFSGAPQFLAICLTVLLVALTLHVAGRRSAKLNGMPAWPFAALPPLAFALQEHLERLMHTGDVPWGAGLEPTFLPGFLLQLPFALLAFAVARALLGAATLLARLLQRAAAARPRRARARAWRPDALVVVRRRVPLACGCSLRGPPMRSLA